MAVGGPDAIMQRILVGERAFSESLPRKASPDVVLLTEPGQHNIIVTSNVMAAVSTNGLLVDVPGAAISLYKVREKYDMLDQTWAALVWVVDVEGFVSLRAFKGSLLNKMAAAWVVDKVVLSGPPGDPFDPAEVRAATLRIISQGRDP